MSGITRAKSKRKTIRMRDGDVCWICGCPIDFSLPRRHAEAATLDHVIPRSKGGENHNDNLKLAHRVCNQKRADAPWWAMEMAA